MSPKRTQDQTIGEMVSEVVDLGAGLGILLLPLLVTALPGVVLLFILPAVLLGAVAAVLGAVAAVVLGPPYLLVRRARRRRST
jgi:hypothetical protein